MTTDKVVYLMRGLPGCGKSYTARRLAGLHGLVLETDEYFYTCVGEDPTQYDYSAEALPAAREWNFKRFQQAVAAATTPIIVDRGNNLTLESFRYARLALDHGYQLELREPESEWWQEIRILLKYRPDTQRVLYQWADRLSEMSRQTHRIPASLIRKGMDQWQLDITLDDILAVGSSPAPRSKRGS